MDIKIQRKVYTIAHEVTFMDTGACIQLQREWPIINPLVSQKEWKRLKPQLKLLSSYTSGHTKWPIKIYGKLKPLPKTKER